MGMIDPSLAKAARKNAGRQFDFHLDRVRRAVQQIKPGKYSRAALFRAMNKRIQLAIPDSYKVASFPIGSGKSRGKLWIFWEPDEDMKQFRLQSLAVPYKDPQPIQQYLPYILTAHAFERAAQRIGTMEPERILGEFRPAARLMMEATFNEQMRGLGEIHVSTENGIACCIINHGGLSAIKTFVDLAKLSSSQLEWRFINDNSVAFYDLIAKQPKLFRYAT